MNRRTLLLLILLIIIIAVWFWLRSTLDSQGQSEISESPIDARNMVVLQEAAVSDETSQAKHFLRQARLQVSTDTTSNSTDDQYFEFDLMAYQKSLVPMHFFNDTEPEVFIELLQKDTDITAEQALTLAFVYNICMQAPKTAWQYEKTLQNSTNILESLVDMNKDFESLDNRINHTEISYEICSTIHPDVDLDHTALYWLEVAADLGHPQAQFLYYEMAREILIGNANYFYQPSTLGVRHPELINNYRVRARAYLRSLLQTGHPRAFLLNAMLLHRGDVLDRDLIVAYANALLAQTESTHPTDKDEAQYMLSLIEQELSPDDMEMAENMVSDLRKQYPEN